MEQLDRQLEQRRREGGFTLVELLVVIVIIGILAAVAVFAVGGITDRGQSAACDAERRSVQTAVEAYRAQNNAAPADMDALTPTFLRDDSEYYTVTNGALGLVPAPPANPCTL